MNDKVRQIAVVLTAIIQIAINTLIGTGIVDFGLASTEAISDSLPTYFTPAGYTFLVWNVIFLGVMAYAVYQLMPAQAARPVHRRIGWWVTAANVGNGLWSIVWGAGGVRGTESFRVGFHVLSGFIIVGILVALAVIVVRLRAIQPQLNRRDEWLIQAPYAAFFAWLNVATIANFTAILVALGVQAGEAGAIWSVIMIGVAAALTSLLILYQRGLIGTLAFAAVIVWAFVGVSAGNAAQSSLVGSAAVIAAVIVVAVTLFRFTTGRGQQALIGARSAS